jgi:uncharacterized protein YkwD
VRCLEQLESRILLAFNPTGLEQELFQLINRFRADPQGELSRLLTSTNPPASADALIQSQLEYWGVSGNLLRSQWANLAPVAPLAWSEPLYRAAQAHNVAMFQHDSQQHQLPGELDPGARLKAAGYDWQRWGENIYAFPRSVAEAHAGFVINWGPGRGGIQDPPNHRLRLLRDEYVHMGIAISDVGTSASRSVGPLLVTQDFAAPLETTTAYVVGAVFKPPSHSTSYVAGSGYGGVQIVFEGTGGTFATTSFGAGGFQLQLPPGTYRARATGGKLPAPLVKDAVVVGTRNVAVDFVYATDRAWVPVATDDVYVIARGTAATLPVLQNDRDPDGVLLPASVSVMVGPDLGRVQVDPTTGRVDYLPDGTWLGLGTFRYEVRDNHGFTSNQATVRVVVVDLLDRPWRNPANALDVNVDEQVTPGDALQILNALAAGQGGPLPVPPPATRLGPPLTDVNGDDVLSPRDALLVINYLNQGGGAEGEPSAGQTERLGDTSAVPIGQVALAGLRPVTQADRVPPPVADHLVPCRSAEASLEGQWLALGAPSAIVVPHARDHVLAPPARALGRRDPVNWQPQEAHDACFRDWPWLEPLAWPVW